MRIGYVLGAGGYPGYPFTLAVLDAVQRYTGTDVREAPVLVGTSIGAMIALLLRAGYSVDDLLAHARGEAMSPASEQRLQHEQSPPGRLPPAMPSWKLPHPRISGAPTAWWAMAGQGRRRSWVPGAASMLVPRGRTDHGVFGEVADSLLPAWPERDTWLVAMRAGDGARRVFGREDVATTGEAVLASSSIPGYFAPVEIDGELHVDAGVLSTTHADLLVDRDDLDLVVVVPPLATATPRAATIDAPLRWLVNAQVDAEVRTLRAAGHAVALLAPPAPVVRTLQGDPIRMSPARVERAMAATSTWALREAGHAIDEARTTRATRLAPVRSDDAAAAATA